MHLFCLFRCGYLARPDRPHGLVSDHHLAPVVDFGGESLHLSLAHSDRLPSLALFQKLSNAEDHPESLLKRVRGLVRNKLVRLVELWDVAPLGVAQNDPVAADVLDHFGRHFTCERAAAFYPAVLSSHGPVGTKLVARGREIWERRTERDFNLSVSLGCLVERSDEVFQRLFVAVAFPVPPHEKRPRHHRHAPSARADRRRRGRRDSSFARRRHSRPAERALEHCSSRNKRSHASPN
mmetsp:Transcript_15404/g.41355  ORF Transcript_15404/g.41355 Transcript_15404/m.41355 type:complete len:237 (+) Transcript_15404:503-1213(+)